ncbi:dihydrofolate reductase family protein [Saccharothrix variisporea]|uniref:Dihydrofolate reductase n=1 Tax=Saccharothrix variisporea TaxID=543527 RepID=A0A495XEE7_9PSEU|nr:dihydrofolate reductase family protein [Saccharothrix variisporea]RKT72387.1 dihydrofolate reductase [Saccharothrix variisporea]
MANVVFTMAVSADGFFEGPDREIGWHRVDEELHQHFNDWLGQVDGFIHGRRTYELMAAYWPTADTDPGASPVEKQFAGIWRDMPKIVYSRTLAEVGWGSTLRREVVPEEVRAAEGTFTIGGAELADEFIRHGLITEYRVYVHPVAIGAGRPMFRRPVDLELLDTQRFGNGVVMLRYAPGDAK